MDIFRTGTLSSIAQLKTKWHSLLQNRSLRESLIFNVLDVRAAAVETRLNSDTEVHADLPQGFMTDSLHVPCNIPLQLGQGGWLVGVDRALGGPPQPEVQRVEVGAVGSPLVDGAERDEAIVEEVVQVRDGVVRCVRWGTVLHEPHHLQLVLGECCRQVSVELPDDFAVALAVNGDSPTTFLESVWAQ